MQPKKLKTKVDREEFPKFAKDLLNLVARELKMEEHVLCPDFETYVKTHWEAIDTVRLLFLL